MIFRELPIAGSYLIDVERIEDDRGFFARMYCSRLFAAQGLQSWFPQSSISYNVKKGTLRGMHYLEEPFSEAKLVRCLSGAIYDVIVDLRSYSKTYHQWIAIELSATSHTAIYVPEGCAHGFQTLADRVEVLYHMSKPYVHEAARGVRWNDPKLNIRWPLPVSSISQNDTCYGDVTKPLKI